MVQMKFQLPETEEAELKRHFENIEQQIEDKFKKLTK